MKKQQKSKTIHNTFTIIFFLIMSSVLFAQSSQITDYQKQLIQALANGNFPDTAHMLCNKLQKLDVYEELLKSLLPLNSLTKSQKILILKELLSLFEALGRWTDVCDCYNSIQKLKQFEPGEILQYAIASLIVGDYEKCSSLLSALHDTEFTEYKRLLNFWILYATSYQTIDINEVEQLVFSKNIYIKISALQLLTYLGDEKAYQKYSAQLEDTTATDFPMFSGIQTYMLSFSMIAAQKPTARIAVQNTDMTSVIQASDTIVLQAGAFSKYENAVTLQKKLESIGIASKIVQRAKDSIFLVLIYTQTKEFQIITIKLKDIGIEAWITNEP